MDVLRGETRTPAFLAMNPSGRGPVLEWEDGRRLGESNAICWHLAEGSAWIPVDAFARAQVLQGRAWFVGAGPTLADLALYASTHGTGEGGLERGRYPAVRAWRARFAARPRHVPIAKTRFP